MLDTALDIAFSAVLTCACGVIIMDLIKDILLTIKSIWDEFRKPPKNPS